MPVANPVARRWRRIIGRRGLQEWTDSRGAGRAAFKRTAAAMVVQRRPIVSERSRLVFSLGEYERRLRLVRDQMQERGIDLLLVEELEHVAYLTGFPPAGTTYQVCIVPLHADPVMIVRGLDVPVFLERSWLGDYVAFRDDQNPVDILRDALHDRGWSGATIGLELDSFYLPVQRHDAIRQALSDATFVDFGGVLRVLRLRKSEEEIAYMRKASEVADAAMLGAIDSMAEGVSERVPPVAAFAKYIEMGADARITRGFTSGARSGTLHGTLGDRILQRGDTFHIELAPRVSGYCGRLMRATVIGEPSEAQAETARLLIQFQDEQIKAMSPGAVASEVDAIAREQIVGAGLRESYENITGYTLGYQAETGVSDFIRTFRPDADWVLEEGMVFHMYVSAGGMSFSETVLVTAGGGERLTRLERKLFVR